MAFEPGTELGLYTILGPLGAGGMGQVYRARDARLHREVAVKVLHEDLTGDPERLARFEREARLLAAVNHPNIATIYHLDEHAGVRFLVMELVPGETLGERLLHGPLPADQAVTLGRQIAEALEAAHEKGIVHRDLKPGNVKVTPRGLVKVLDFGLAKDLAAVSAPVPEGASSPSGDATPAGVLLGTPAYMSPEQARGQPVDRRADVWAFGCVLYEALTGRRAFEGPTVTDTLVRILEREPDWDALPADTPPGLRELLRRCLRKDPDRRLRDMADARIELEELAGMPTPPPPTLDLAPVAQTPEGATTLDRTPMPSTAEPGPQEVIPLATPVPEAVPVLPLEPPPAARPARRSRRPWWIAAGVAVLLLAGVGMGLWLSGAFSQRQEPAGMRMRFGIDGMQIEGNGLGPDGGPGGIQVEFPNIFGGPPGVPPNTKPHVPGGGKRRD